MKRQIKFRVYTGIEMDYNVMAGSLGTFYVAGIDQKDSSSLSPLNTKYSDNAPIMQFTGLLDKNGKEIYEGDILIPTKLRMRKFVVEFSAGRFIGRPAGKNPRAISNISDLADLKIAGNIYENPELLN